MFEGLVSYLLYLGQYLLDILIVIYGIGMVMLSQIKLKEKHPAVCAWLQTIGILVILLYIRAIKDGAIK